MTVCICGCGRSFPLDPHHILYQAELRRVARSEQKKTGRPSREKALCADHRNLVPVHRDCHAAHHNRSRPLALHVLPDSVFEFATELLGASAAFVYFRRRYAGGDARLDALIEEEAA